MAKHLSYDDRLEISSPGKLPNIVDLNNMKYTRYSRNPIIARILFELGWVKELNEGVKRIYEEMERFFFLKVSLSCISTATYPKYQDYQLSCC